MRWPLVQENLQVCVCVNYWKLARLSQLGRMQDVYYFGARPLYAMQLNCCRLQLLREHKCVIVGARPIGLNRAETNLETTAARQ